MCHDSFNSCDSIFWIRVKMYFKFLLLYSLSGLFYFQSSCKTGFGFLDKPLFWGSTLGPISVLYNDSNNVSVP